jgi:hypothetical protein
VKRARRLFEAARSVAWVIVLAGILKKEERDGE